ncbi:flagellar biosynthesis anti-sigma factor FlgM [bacterium]|nr:flagellar biosynthesis anti-sigma factor FlgM [bacterium]
MKISGRKSVSGAGSVKGPSRAGQAGKAEQSPQVEKATKVELSGSHREIDKAREILAQLPDVRVEKVENIKPLIDEGSYQVESKVLAKKMVDSSIRESATMKVQSRKGSK